MFHTSSNPSPGTEPVSGRASAELEVAGLGKFKIGQVATIGRSPESHVVLNLPLMSRHHARIFHEGGHYWIKDLNSANGITVNGKRVRLQMLSDQDKICFGDAAAVFRTSERTSGPAPLAQDPLAGSENAVSDGTPTGGLDGGFPGLESRRPAGVQAGAQPAVIAADTELQAMTKKIENLQAENEHFRREITQYRSTATGIAIAVPASPDGQEVERLRGLVSRLERALADSNQRLRNLQQRPDDRK
jgi:pSer/pThr/pTyr-binding forkhead associated (FHA) protein